MKIDAKTSSVDALRALQNWVPPSPPRIHDHYLMLFKGFKHALGPRR